MSKTQHSGPFLAVGVPQREESFLGHLGDELLRAQKGAVYEVLPLLLGRQERQRYVQGQVVLRRPPLFPLQPLFRLALCVVSLFRRRVLSLFRLRVLSLFRLRLRVVNLFRLLVVGGPRVLLALGALLALPVLLPVAVLVVLLLLLFPRQLRGRALVLLPGGRAEGQAGVLPEAAQGVRQLRVVLVVLAAGRGPLALQRLLLPHVLVDLVHDELGGVARRLHAGRPPPVQVDGPQHRAHVHPGARGPRAAGVAAQAAAPAAPALLPAGGPRPAGAAGPAPAEAAAQADGVQAVHAGHLHRPGGLPVPHGRWAPGPSPAPPVRVHGPVRTSGWLEPGARAVPWRLRLFPLRLVLGAGAVVLPPLVHRGAPAPAVAGGPSAKRSGGCPAAARV